MTVEQILIALRRGASAGYSLSVSADEALALVAEVSLLQQEARIRRAIGDGLAAEVERLLDALGATHAEAATMRAWAEEAARAENENARDLEVATARAVEAERERDEWRASQAGQRKRADSLAQAYLHEQGENDKLRVEIAACRNQVASALAIGVSLHKAADTGAKSAP